MAKDAGMKYITITSKHHDGFGMWGSKQSDWNIVDRTPYHQDVLKMLADECHRQGIKLFFYHSQLDWHNPNYFPLGRTGLTAGRPTGGDWYKYLDYMDAQLRELLTGYGEIGGIWFDGMWDKPDADWRLGEDLRADSQPATGGAHRQQSSLDSRSMVKISRCSSVTCRAAGRRSSTRNPRLELCRSRPVTRSMARGVTTAATNGSRRRAQLIQYLVKAAGNNGNFLLNVGPMPSGKIQTEFVERLHAVGDWLRKNGDSIYGTRGGPVKPRPWGVTTQKAGKIYVHLLDWPDQLLALPKLANVTKATLLMNGKAVEVRQVDDGTILRLPDGRDPIDTIIVLATDERR